MHDAMSPPDRLASEARCLHADAFAVLEALALVILPSDLHGPSAAEADVPGQLDRMLRSAPTRQKEYMTGLKALDELARKRCGRGFSSLPHDQQVKIVAVVERAKQGIYCETVSWGGRVRRKFAFLYYSSWMHLAALADFWNLVRADVMTIFYSSPNAWNWLHYDGLSATSDPSHQRPLELLHG